MRGLTPGRAGGVAPGRTGKAGCSRSDPGRGPLPWPVQPPRSACRVLPLCLGAARPLCSPAPLPAAKDPGKRPTGGVFFSPTKGCSGAPSSKSRFSKWGGPGRSRGSVGAPWAETRGTKPLCCTRDLPARRDPPGAFLPRPGTCAGRYPPAGRCHGPETVPDFPRSPGRALPSASFAGSRCSCRIPPHGGPPRSAWMALPPLPARQVTRQKGWWLLGTPMLGTPGTLAPPLPPGPGDAPASVVLGGGRGDTP